MLQQPRWLILKLSNLQPFPNFEGPMVALKCAHCGQKLSREGIPNEAETDCPSCGKKMHPVSMDPNSPTRLDEVAPNPSVDSARTVLDRTTPNPGQKASTPRNDSGDIHAANQRPFAFLTEASEPGSLGMLAHYRIIRVIGRGGMGVVFERSTRNLTEPSRSRP